MNNDTIDTATPRRWTVEVTENPDNPDEAIIELPPEALALAGLQAGDTVKWTELDNGAWTITKVEEPMTAVPVPKREPTKLVLVDTVSMFRMRYLIEMPAHESSEWALDTVVMKEAREFSQVHLDETIVSHRDISHDDALALCREDNDYTHGWSDDQMVKVFWTRDNNGGAK